MAIPDFQSVMRPLLEHLNDGAEHENKETLKFLAAHFGLTEEEVERQLPSGNQGVFTNRVAWAKSHLKKAGLVASPRRAVYQITDRGKQALLETDSSINMNFLNRYAEYAEFRRPAKSENPETDSSSINGNSLTPQEQIDFGHEQIRTELAAEILEKLKQSTPEFFERVVVDLLVAMGYGGSRSDAGQALGKGGDGGIDGIIKEDRLGLETIYLQAKRWEGSVGRPEIQKFAGALQGQFGRKGVFITTSSFTKDAVEFVERLDRKIVLIDGAELAELMIDHGIGVTTLATYELKRLDSDYFLAD